MLEDVGSDQPVSVTHDVFFRNADNAIVELEFANYNLVHPGRVAAGRSGVSYTFERMFSEPPRSNFFRELLPDGHAGSAGIKQESLYRRVIELYAQTNTSRDHGHARTRERPLRILATASRRRREKRFQFELRPGNIADRGRYGLTR